MRREHSFPRMNRARIHSPLCKADRLRSSSIWLRKTGNDPAKTYAAMKKNMRMLMDDEIRSFQGGVQK